MRELKSIMHLVGSKWNGIHELEEEKQMERGEQFTSEIIWLKGYLSDFNKEEMLGIIFHGF